MSPKDVEHSLGLATIFAAAIFAVAAATATKLSSLPKVRRVLTPQNDRNGCLDGMRGVLALGVFVHHSLIAYLYFEYGTWALTSSSLINQLGQTSVAIFFMITGFLFSKRLLIAYETHRSVQWRELYISRLARLSPLYIVVVSAVAVSAIALSGWALNETNSEFVAQLATWYLFCLPGRPDINQIPQTWTVMAGVNWSLRYEWFFYLTLPLIFLPLRWFASRNGAKAALVLLALFLLLAFVFHKEITGARLFVLHFVCGVTAALIHQDPALRAFIASRRFHAVAVPALLLLLGFYQTAYAAAPIALTFIIFLTVLGGYSAGGFLRTPTAIWLGEISYGIYLIHGPLLFWTLFALKQWGVLSNIPLLNYVLIIAFVGVVLVLISSISFLFIEKPIISLAKKYSNTLPATSMAPEM